MGIIDGLMGNASETDIEDIKEKYQKLLAPGETIEQAYSLIRDKILLTNIRMILINKQGVTGKKTEYHSIPYGKITHFSIETAGNLDMDAELRIWVAGMGNTAIEKTFGKDQDVFKVQSVLAKHVAGE